jgi:hypothetical protein
MHQQLFLLIKLTHWLQQEVKNRMNPVEELKHNL